jgi:hypothetical protein
MASKKELDYKTASREQLVRRSLDLRTRTGPMDDADAKEVQKVQNALKERDAQRPPMSKKWTEK